MKSSAPRWQQRPDLAAVCAAFACTALIDAAPVVLPATDGFVSKLDDLAHVATAVIIVVLLRPRPPFAAALIVGSVAIDLDHVPDMAGWSVPNEGAGRPYHSLVVVALLVAVAVLVPKIRSIAAGAATGVAVHLWRDLATGPGVPLTWPLSTALVRLPYSVFAISVLAAVALSVVRARPRSESASQ
jgi:inner membrane protein